MIALYTYYSLLLTSIDHGPIYNFTGVRLASIVLPIFDPSFPPIEDTDKYELPKYTQPKLVYAKLPGMKAI